MAIPTTGLLAEYLGSISGGQLLDSSGNSRHATLSGSGTTEDTTHPLGIGVQFDGNGYATMPSGAYPTGVSNWTIALWFYQPTRASSWEAMLEIGRFASQERIGCLLEGGTWKLVLTDDDDKAYHDVGDYTGSWHFLVWKWDGTTTTCYYDSATPSETYTLHDFDIYDAGLIGASPGGGNKYSGKMARIRIYDRALSDAEVSQIYSEIAAIGVVSLPHSLLTAGGVSFPHRLHVLFSSVTLPHSMAIPVKSCSFPHALSDSIARTCTMPHSLRAVVEVQFGVPHGILAYTPAVARCSLPHAALDTTPETLPEVTVTIAGNTVEIISFDVTQDIEQHSLQASFDVADMAAWIGVEIGDDAVLDIGGQSISLVVDGKTSDRQFGSASYKIDASSPASRLADPYSELITKEWSGVEAREIAQELCDLASVTMDWQLCDWPVNTYAVEGQTPMAALTGLVTEAAVLVSDLDGTLVIQWRYPVSPPKYATETPAMSINDWDDIKKESAEWIYRPGYNAVEIMAEGSGANAGITLQAWTGPNSDSDGEMFETLLDIQRYVAAITWPWQDLELSTTDCDASVFPHGIYEFEHENTVEVVEGAASVSWPIYDPADILETEWICADLGSVTAEGTQILSETVGYSVLRIKYKSKVQLWLIESTSENLVQVVTEGSETTVASGTLIAEVVRGDGDRVAPDIIADPLCTTEAIARQRGRNYLDENGYNVVRYQADTPPRSLLLPGAIVAVESISIIDAWRGHVLGWQLQGSLGKSSISWKVERPLVEV